MRAVLAITLLCLFAAAVYAEQTFSDVEAQASYWPFGSSTEAEKCDKSARKNKRCGDHDTNCEKCLDETVGMFSSTHCTFAFARSAGIAGSRCVENAAEFNALTACAKKANPSANFVGVQFFTQQGGKAQCAKTSGTLQREQGTGVISTITNWWDNRGDNKLTQEMTKAVQQQDCDSALECEAEWKERTAEIRWKGVGDKLHENLYEKSKLTWRAARNALKSRDYGKALRAAVVAQADRAMAKSVPKQLQSLSGALVHKGKCMLLQCMLRPNTVADVSLKQPRTNKVVGTVRQCAICADKSRKAFFMDAGMKYLGLRDAADDIVQLCDAMAMASSDVTQLIDGLATVYDKFTQAFISLQKPDLDAAVSATKRLAQSAKVVLKKRLPNLPGAVNGLVNQAKTQAANYQQRNH